MLLQIRLVAASTPTSIAQNRHLTYHIPHTSRSLIRDFFVLPLRDSSFPIIHFEEVHIITFLKLCNRFTNNWFYLDCRGY